MLRGTAIGLACNIQRGWRAKAPISTFAAPVCPINGGTRLPKREGLRSICEPLIVYADILPLSIGLGKAFTAKVA